MPFIRLTRVRDPDPEHDRGTPQPMRYPVWVNVDRIVNFGPLRQDGTEAKTWMRLAGDNKAQFVLETPEVIAKKLNGEGGA